MKARTILAKKEGLGYPKAVFRRDSRGGKVLAFLELKDSYKKLTRENNAFQAHPGGEFSFSIGLNLKLTEYTNS